MRNCWAPRRGRSRRLGEQVQRRGNDGDRRRGRHLTSIAVARGELSEQRRKGGRGQSAPAALTTSVGRGGEQMLGLGSWRGQRGGAVAASSGRGGEGAPATPGAEGGGLRESPLTGGGRRTTPRDRGELLQTPRAHGVGRKAAGGSLTPAQAIPPPTLMTSLLPVKCCFMVSISFK